MPKSIQLSKKEDKPIFSRDCVSFFQQKVFGGGADETFMSNALNNLKRETGVDPESCRDAVNIIRLQEIVNELNREDLQKMLEDAHETQKYKPY